MRENGSKSTNKVLLVILIILFVIAAALFVITDPFDIFHLGLMEKIFPSAGDGMDYIAAGSENPADVSAPGTPQPMKTPTAAPECNHKKAYVSFEREATCTISGYKSYHCPDCGDDWTEYIPNNSNNHTGYTYTTDSRDATCTEKGYSGDKHCSNCRNIIEYGHDTPPTGHKAGPWVEVKAPTTSQQGRSEKKCKVCGTVLQTEYSTRVPTSIPRRTATPKRTPVPTQRPVDGGNRLIVTNYKGVNIRKQGNSGSDKVGHLDQGDVVTYSGSFSYGSKAYVQIKHSGGSGYVNTNDSANPFVVRFSEYYSSPKKISMNNGTNLYLLPDGSTSNRNKVAAADSGRQYTCIGKVNGIDTSSSYYVVKCDSKCKYTDPDSGNKYTIQYAFVRERDVKNIK